jgi:hypothetical protein
MKDLESIADEFGFDVALGLSSTSLKMLREIAAWRYLHFQLNMHVCFEPELGVLNVHDSHGSYTAFALGSDKAQALIDAAQWFADRSTPAARAAVIARLRPQPA